MANQFMKQKQKNKSENDFENNSRNDSGKNSRNDSGKNSRNDSGKNSRHDYVGEVGTIFEFFLCGFVPLLVLTF
jgi:hypothetical protein